MKKLWLLVVVVLTTLFAWQWRNWPPTLPAPPSVADLADVAETSADRPAADLSPLPTVKEDFASVIERPLFLPDRRPPPPMDAPVAEPLPEPAPLTALDLTAVIITPRLVSAWVQRPGERRPVTLRLGDEFDGWTVQAIESDRIVFGRQGATDALELRDYKHSKMPGVPLQSRPPEPPPQGGRRPTDGRLRNGIPPG